jgi:hypothetical protein
METVLSALSFELHNCLSFEEIEEWFRDHLETLANDHGCRCPRRYCFTERGDDRDRWGFYFWFDPSSYQNFFIAVFTALGFEVRWSTPSFYGCDMLITYRKTDWPVREVYEKLRS